jgi:putative DNA primase/helicase
VNTPIYSLENARTDLINGTPRDVVRTGLITFGGRTSIDADADVVTLEKAIAANGHAPKDVRAILTPPTVPINNAAGRDITVETPKTSVVPTNGHTCPFLERALPMVARGIPIIPLKVNDKAPFMNGWPAAATTNLEQVNKWASENPNYNCGCVAQAKIGGYLFLEVDSPDVLARITAETGHAIPPNFTMMVRSRDGRGHIYLGQTDASIALGNISQSYVKHGDWSLRVDNQFVVGPNSIHPTTGKPYLLKSDDPIALAPDWLVAWCASQKVEKSANPTQDIPLDANKLIPHGFIHGAMLTQAGKLRNMGYSVEVIETALLEWTHKNCAQPVDDDKVKAMARSVGQYIPGENTDLLLTQTPAQPEPQTAQATGKRLNVRGATSFSTKKIKWLWPHRVPLGKLTLFVGVPGGGKSLAAGDVAARLSTGKNWYDSDNVFRPSETLMLVGEDDIEDTTIPRLQAAGADLSKIHFLKSVITMEGEGKTTEERELQFDKDLIQVEEFLGSHPNIRLIVVDPVSNYMGSAKMNSEQEVRAVLIPLKNLAERLTVALIGIMHLNKKNETSAINRVGGAMAFVGVARAAYLFQKSEEENGYLEDQHFMVLLKCNITKKVDGLVYEISAKEVDVEGSPEWMPYIKFTSTTTKNAEGLLQPKSETAGRPPVQSVAVKEWLKAFLSDGPVRSSEVIKAGKELHNFSKGTIERARTELAVTSVKEGKLWLWSLPIQEEAVTVSLDAK